MACGLQLPEFLEDKAQDLARILYRRARVNTQATGIAKAAEAGENRVNKPTLLANVLKEP